MLHNNTKKLQNSTFFPSTSFVFCHRARIYGYFNAPVEMNFSLSKLQTGHMQRSSTSKETQWRTSQVNQTRHHNRSLLHLEYRNISKIRKYKYIIKFSSTLFRTFCRKKISNYIRYTAEKLTSHEDAIRAQQRATQLMLWKVRNIQSDRTLKEAALASLTRNEAQKRVNNGILCKFSVQKFIACLQVQGVQKHIFNSY